jgi:superfamily II DNA helicase RecQ
MMDDQESQDLINEIVSKNDSATTGDWAAQAEGSGESAYSDIGNRENNLTGASTSQDGACIGDVTDSTRMENNEVRDAGPFTTVMSKKNQKNVLKRGNEVMSPQELTNRKVSRIAENIDKRKTMVFIKTVDESINLQQKNPLSIKRALLGIDYTITNDQIKCYKNIVKIACSTEIQKEKLLKVTKLMDYDVTATEHNALTRESVSLNEMFRVIIFGVCEELTMEQICDETGATRAKRLLKNDPLENTRRETGTVILTFTDEPPRVLYIGIKKHYPKLYVPPPVRCWRCQLFGHVEANCHRKLTCPNCSLAHAYSDCPLLNQTTNSESTIPVDKLNCPNCGQNHSAAFRGCPVYQQQTIVMQVQATERITYSQALKKVTNQDAQEGDATFLKTIPVSQFINSNPLVVNKDPTRIHMVDSQTDNVRPMNKLSNMNNQLLFQTKSPIASTSKIHSAGQRRHIPLRKTCSTSECETVSESVFHNIYQGGAASSEHVYSAESTVTENSMDKLLFLFIELLKNFLSTDKLVNFLENTLFKLKREFTTDEPINTKNCSKI